MALQFSVAVRNARLDAIEVAIGASAVLELRTGAPPANCAAADSGTLIASLSLPASWMADAAAGAKALSGTWEDLSANNAGTIAHFRVKDSGATVCGMQGTVTATGGGGDLTVDNPAVAATQKVVVTGFTLTDGNA